MFFHLPRCCAILILLIYGTDLKAVEPRSPIVMAPEDAEPWETLTFLFLGPTCSETDTDPNPYLDYRMILNCKHTRSGQQQTFLGHFAADGHAWETSASTGNIWRAYVRLGLPGEWTWTLSFTRGKNAGIDHLAESEPVRPLNELSRSITIKSIEKMPLRADTMVC